MIKVNGIDIAPTIFPDKTSQIWKLPPPLIDADVFEIEWRFETEREIIDVASLATLLKDWGVRVELYMPYLPYARQDKLVNNDATFNLAAFSLLLGAMDFDKISALDVHNPNRCMQLMPNFHNRKVDKIHEAICEKIQPDVIVYPDHGAHARYPHLFIHASIIFNKERNQETGEIISINANCPRDVYYKTALIVDDICDGGRTFIEAAKVLRTEYPNIKIHLFVTHGIFSKGKDHLLKNGIDFVHTTNSLKQYTEMEIFNV